jgi:hypothetical protein
MKADPVMPTRAVISHAVVAQPVMAQIVVGEQPVMAHAVMAQPMAQQETPVVQGVIVQPSGTPLAMHPGIYQQPSMQGAVGGNLYPQFPPVGSRPWATGLFDCCDDTNICKRSHFL